MDLVQALLLFWVVYMFIRLGRSMWSQPMENAKLIAFILFVDSTSAFFRGIQYLENFLK